MINRDLILANCEVYSRKFNLDLEREPFQWFLLSVLFGTRITQSIALRTFVMFRNEGVTTPESIIESGFDGLVSILDSGGYTRYDFRTAVKLEEMSRNILKAGDLRSIYSSSKDQEELVSNLKGLAKGIGDVTVGIFLREMVGVWEKADPYPSTLVLSAAEFAAVSIEDYRKYGVTYAEFESFLIKVGRECLRSRSGKMAGFCRLVSEKE